MLLASFVHLQSIWSEENEAERAESTLKIEKPDKTKKPPKTAALLREKEEKEKKLLSLATIEL